jgi:hypothetical protein
MGGALSNFGYLCTVHKHGLCTITCAPPSIIVISISKFCFYLHSRSMAFADQSPPWVLIKLLVLFITPSDDIGTVNRIYFHNIWIKLKLKFWLKMYSNLVLIMFQVARVTYLRFNNSHGNSYFLTNHAHLWIPIQNILRMELMNRGGGRQTTLRRNVLYL